MASYCPDANSLPFVFTTAISRNTDQRGFAIPVREGNRCLGGVQNDATVRQMSHGTVFGRHGNTTSRVNIGFSKHHLVEISCTFAGHKPLFFPWLGLFSKLGPLPNFAIFRSKCQTQAELQLAHGASGGDRTKSRGSEGGAISRGGIETHGVEDIIGVCSKLNIHAFPEAGETEITRDCQVHVLEGRAAQHVSAGVPVDRNALNKSRRILRERSSIEPFRRRAVAQYGILARN